MDNQPLFVKPPHLGQMSDPLGTEWNAALPSDPTALARLIDFQSLNQIFDGFLEVVGLPVAIIDLNAHVLASSRWQRLCMEFHRVHPETRARCIESDTSLASAMHRGRDYAIYRCGNGLTDCAAPIRVEGRHVANLFIGQFLLASPDLEAFRRRASECGFDETAYLQALAEVPVIDETRLPAIMGFLTGFAQLVTDLSLARRRIEAGQAELEQRVEERTRDLKRSNEDLEQFAYAISHDMRQPLRMVSSYLHLLGKALPGQLDDETRQYLDFAMEGARRMDGMILGLLNLSRVGRKAEPLALLETLAALDDALAFLGPEITATSGAVEAAGQWPRLVASRDELVRLLQNLVGNALKYHEEGQAPLVRVEGRRLEGWWRCEVRDEGIGIDPAQSHRLFKVFSRLQSRARYEGAGIGLALCRRIVERHGGRIGVESAGEGRGSCFWFELPLAISEASPRTGDLRLET